MKRLKQLRESANYTQEQLAKMVKVSRQTIACWEGGKSEPNLTALRDLSLIFGTSVNELLSYEKTGEKPSSIHYYIFNNELDGYWGDIGLKIGGKPSIWFPISYQTMNRVFNQLKQLDNEEDWIVFSAMNNKYVVFRPATIDKVTFLDEACDSPESDGELPEAMVAEFYPAFNVLNTVPDVDWNKANTILFGQDKNSESSKEFWTALIKKVTPYFNGEASEIFIKTITEQFVESSLYDEDKFIQSMSEINVHYTNGSVEKFDSDVEDITEFMFTLNMDDTVKNIKFTVAYADVFIPLSKISTVIMPYTDVLKMEEKTEEEMDREE